MVHIPIVAWDALLCSQEIWTIVFVGRFELAVDSAVEIDGRTFARLARVVG